MKGGEGVKGVKEIPTHFRKMVKCMIYIGTYAWGKCVGIPFTPFTPFTASPRRPRPLGGSVINGTIQQLLDTARASTVSSNLDKTPHSAPTWFHPRGCGKAPTAPTQRHTAAQRGFTARHPLGCGKPPTAACQGLCGYISPLGNLEKQSKGINP